MWNEKRSEELAEFDDPPSECTTDTLGTNSVKKSAAVCGNKCLGHAGIGKFDA